MSDTESYDSQPDRGDKNWTIKEHKFILLSLGDTLR